MKFFFLYWLGVFALFALLALTAGCVRF